MNYYAVSRDYQGGTFGMYRAISAKDWGETACDWVSDSETPESWLLENYDCEEDLIRDISDWFELEFVKLNRQQKEKYDKLLHKIDKKSSDWYDAYEKGNMPRCYLIDESRLKLEDELDKLLKSASKV